MVWGKRWIVKTSTLGERHGYGVYACEDIIVEDSTSYHREGPTLFPYGGPIYKRRHWNRILTQHPEWKTFALEMDTFAGSTRRHSDRRVIDGLPSPVTLLLLCELTHIATCDTSTTGKFCKNL